MSSKEWKTYKLDEISEFHNAKRVPLNSRERDIKRGSYPYYGASGIVDYLNDYTFDGNYVLISEDGENLRSRKTPIAFRVNGKFRVNNHAHIVKAKESFLNDWIVYFFQNFDLNPFITGAVQPKLNKENLQLIEIPIPEFKVAKIIITILSSLDEKIELNRQTNQTLEGIAQTLFQEMCVPKGDELPEGWRVGKLRDIVEINPKLSLKKGSVSKYIEMKDLSENSMIIKRCIDREFASGSKFQNGDTLLARITPCLENGKTGMVNLLEGDEVGWGSTEFIVLREKKGLGEYFVYCLARTNAFREYAIQSMVGSSGRQRVVDSILADFDLGIPTENTLKNFHNAVKPLFEQIFSLEQENQTLIALRDSLLPKLMKGDIEI
jgi:type I restriction enzyme, S subunit